jgi:Cdc6-like AAA superfamily ATPase
MIETWNSDEAELALRAAFKQEEISIEDLVVRQFPEETIFVVSVPPAVLTNAARAGNRFDNQLLAHGFNGFVTVREAPESPAAQISVKGVHDDRAIELVRLLQARARTSESQPALMYVPDSAATIAQATATRHNLVFGRRGAGKTALLLEAKARLERQGALAVWANLQPYRWQDWSYTAASVIQATLEKIQVHYREATRAPQVLADATSVHETLSGALASETIPNMHALLARVQRTLSKFTKTAERPIYIFLDDFYFVPRRMQVELLDALHACVRDADAWLKIATIKHLSRWFDPSRQLGLQIGHDSESLDLDVTLQEPARAKAFLETVLSKYGDNAGIGSIGRIFSSGALDRLVLASGSVPRDYLLLASNAISKARERPHARTVGVQDVNNAAGDAARLKLQELDEDLSPNSEWVLKTKSALNYVRAFCLDERHWTYFRVDFREKEHKPGPYELLASLMDLRMIHLVNPSVSDEQTAGEKAEVYMLDLSQYSAHRLKKFLHVLDFRGGHFVLRETGKKGSDVVGDSPKKLISILRRAPRIDLDRLVAGE